MSKDNIPDDAQYYTSGEIKKYWKKETHIVSGKESWWVWSKMFSEWIERYDSRRIPMNLVRMPETDIVNLVQQLYLKNFNGVMRNC